MTDNPYQTPNSEVEPETIGQTYQLVAPKSVSVGRGWGWIADGFSLFKRSPGSWILTVLIWLVIMIGVSLIPLLGQIALMLTTYIFIGGIMLGCRAQDDGKPFEINHLFAGFSNSTSSLLLLSVVVAILSMVVMVITMGPLYFSLLTGDPAANQQIMDDFSGVILSILFGMLLLIPLLMCIWFAPALIVLHKVGIMEACKLSFFGCLKNFVPFLLYGVIGLLLYIVAIIPLALGLLVFFPVILASIYTSYKDIFIEG